MEMKAAEWSGWKSGQSGDLLLKHRLKYTFLNLLLRSWVPKKKKKKKKKKAEAAEKEEYQASLSPLKL